MQMEATAVLSRFAVDFLKNLNSELLIEMSDAFRLILKQHTSIVLLSLAKLCGKQKRI